MAAMIGGKNINDILNYFTNYQPAKIADKFV